MNITLFHIESDIEKHLLLKNQLRSIVAWEITLENFSLISSAQKRLKSKTADLLIISLNADLLSNDNYILELESAVISLNCIFLIDSKLTLVKMTLR